MAGRIAICITLVLLGGSTAQACGYGFYRWMGYQGLEIVLRDYDEVKAKLDSATTSEDATVLRSELERLATAVDEVASQRHATVSRLYWYTDLEKAKTAATESGKPILTLRMLGKLTDEFSCANSRFFRTVLYANKQVGDALREKFILHWESERPVPRVTIDFGDGRKLERTLTGNSAHYLLTAKGEPLDVLPGLYGPKEFLAWLDRTEALSGAYTAETDEKKKAQLLSNFHRDRLSEVHEAWLEDVQKVAPELLGDNNIALLQTIAPELLSDERVTLPFNDKRWQLVAQLHPGDATLDEQSVKLIREEQSDAFEAGARSMSKSFVEDPILRQVRTFQNSIALDTVRNEYLLHRQIHAWFAAGEAPSDFGQLNDRVYSELFLTPASDPWLGLAPVDTYTALENSGLSVTESR